MSGFWNPARLGEAKQLEIDKRVILGISKNKLEKDLERVNKKIEKHREVCLNLDFLALTKAKRISLNIKFDNLAFERNQIERRLDLIKTEMGDISGQESI